MPILTEEDVVAVLRAEVRRFESITAWAERASLDRSCVSSAIHQNRPISRSIIRALGLRTAVVDGASRVLTKGDILKLLKANVVAVGGQSAWARKNRMNRVLLNKALRKRRPLPAAMVRALGLRFVVISD
jgi:DNA-binding phage protein